MKTKLLMSAGVGILLTAGSFSTVFAATSNVTPQYDVEFEWQVVSVGSPYTSYGSWNFGTSGTNNGDANSQLSFSQNIGYANTVTGTNNVSDGTLSASVGFSVTYSSSSTAQFSMTLLPGQSGEIDWRNTYSSKNVTEEQYEKPVIGGNWQPDGNYAYCTANEWIGFNYQGYNT